MSQSSQSPPLLPPTVASTSAPSSPPALDEQKKGHGRRKRRTVWMVRCGVVLVIVCAVALATTVVPLGIGSMVLTMPVRSMAPTVVPGDYVYVNLRSYRNGETPERGDLVVFWSGDVPRFETGTGNAGYILKRVVGLPGETITIKEGRLTVNGEVPPELHDKRYTELSVPGAKSYHEGTTLTIPPEHVYVLGDNVDNSYDSRFWGPLPMPALRGRAEICLWPPDRVHGY